MIAAGDEFSKTAGCVQIKWYTHIHTAGSRYVTCFHRVINGQHCVEIEKL